MMSYITSIESDPAGDYMFKVNNRNIRTRCETWSKLTIKTPKQHQWRRTAALVFLLLTLSR